jgi:anaerobic magnesium-protoporphyrin IX monomethyl ester cyclase
MADPKKNLVLVFPPLTMPTSPPLGVSMLKGFVERELPEWRVKVLDLNVWTFDRLFGELAVNRIQLDPRTFPEGAAAVSGLLKAAAAFRGRNNQEFYSRPDLYDHYGELFLRFTETFTQQIAAACQSCEKGTPLPPLFQEYLELILAEKPDAVGFSMIFSEQLAIGALLGKVLRTTKGLPVVLGGSCFADTAEHFLKWYPECADVIVAGEGEEALKILLNDFNALERVPGAVYFKDGKVEKVAKSFPKDIDFYGAPDFSDFDLKSYYSPEPVVPLLLSRGCYWRRCTFCVHYRSAGLTYRMHTMDFTIEMLKGFVAQGIRNFAFIDEMISPKHFTWLAEGIKEADLDISYYALTKPTKEFTPAILSTIKASGCKYLLWGLESGNQRVLNLMDKGSKVEDVAQVLKNAHAAGIGKHVFLICGFPTETEDEFADTIKFLDDNKDYIYAVHRGTFSLEPESPIFEEQKRFGIKRAWMVQDSPSGGRWAFEVESGMSQQRVKEVFIAALPLFRAFNPYARYAANFRDHALLLYGRSELKPAARRFPRILYGQKSLGPNDRGLIGSIRVGALGTQLDGKEITDDCKSGMVVSVPTPGPAATAQAPNGLTAEQVADFLANDPKLTGRFVISGN